MCAVALRSKLGEGGGGKQNFSAICMEKSGEIMLMACISCTKFNCCLLSCLQMFDQLCNDLSDVHPAVLFVTFLFGTLGFLYFFWSLTVSIKYTCSCKVLIVL